MTNKFKVGDEVNVSFHDVQYTGTIVALYDDGKAEGPHYVVESEEGFYLSDTKTHKEKACNMRTLVWFGRCLKPALPQINIGDYPVKIHNDGNAVSVGCRTVSIETIREILNRMESAKGKVG